MNLIDRIKEKLFKPNPKILLVHPSFRYTGSDRFPLGLGYIASYLRKYSYNIHIIDEQKQQIGKYQLEQIKPDIIGISSTSPSFHRTRKLLNSIYRLPDHKRPLILVGGTHASFCSDEVLEAGADLVFRGESDLSIQQLFNQDKLEDISGISFYNNGMVQHNPTDSLIEDLDLIPFPARDLFDKSLYSVMSLTTSRGCPYNCHYCSATQFWKNKVRYHSIPYVEKELEQISSLGYNYVIFEDATFSANIKRAQNICHTLVDNPKLKKVIWSCETRPDRLNRSLVASFEESRCILIDLGIESASDAVLRRNNRTVSLSKLYNGMEVIQETQIPLQVLLIFGLPGETRESVQETIQFLNDFKPDRVILSLATAYPGTELWKTTQRIEMPLAWVRKFTGHGEFSPLYLSEDLTPSSYRELGENLLSVVNQVNKANLEKYRRKQDQIYKQTKI